jgi:hypothetical protein
LSVLAKIYYQHYIELNRYITKLSAKRYERYVANLKGVPRYGRGFFAVDKTEFKKRDRDSICSRGQEILSDSFMDV